MNTSALSNQTRLLGAVTIVGAILLLVQFLWFASVQDATQPP